MLIALTGTPGTGKTSISYFLRKNDIKVVDLNCIATTNNFFIGFDK